MIRENWLNAAVEIFRPRFVEIGLPLPEVVRISVGFPLAGARGENRRILGITVCRKASTAGVNEVFISPLYDNAHDVLATVLHELIHAADDLESGHRGRFADAFAALGFEGSTLSVTPGVTLSMEFATIAASLGPYPHAALDADILCGKRDAPVAAPVGGDEAAPVRRRVSSGPVTQTTRMIKVSCVTPDCECGGYTVRTTRRWLDIGSPLCPAGQIMME